MYLDNSNIFNEKVWMTPPLLKKVGESILKYTPIKFQIWVKNELIKARVFYGGFRFVPQEQLRCKYREALLFLAEKYGSEALGNYLEFGVCHGSSIACMYQVLQELKLQNLRLFGFDSFEGLPDTASPKTDGAVAWLPGQCASSIKFTKRFLVQQGVDLNQVNLIKGWFKDTLNDETIHRYGLVKASIILIDSDIYTSGKEALSFCEPLIQDSAIIFFDDWNHDGLAKQNMGEKLAFDEFLAENPHFTTEHLGRYTDNAEIFLVSRIQ